MVRRHFYRVGPQGPLAPFPTQQTAGVAYANSGDPGLASTVPAYNHPGALLAAGRENYADQVFKDVSAAGGTVLIYLDIMVIATVGRYHDLLFNKSVYGPAVPQWGTYVANSAAGLNLADFRVGGILQTKLRSILELMVSENPHMGGFFADDLGSRSWYPDINWTTFPAQDKADWRAGAIAATQIFRDVCDAHGLYVIVNGTWTANDGGGYPDSTQHGNAYADGGFVEHHDGGIAFFGPYAASTQWASQSRTTHGSAFHWAVMDTSAGVTEFVNNGNYAYVALQTSANYDYPPTPGSAFRANGLPSKVSQ